MHAELAEIGDDGSSDLYFARRKTRHFRGAALVRKRDFEFH